MSSATLTSLAILKVNWDRLGKDYVENFVPFVAEALRSGTEDVVSLSKLQESLKAGFGLDLPLNPLRHVLQRAAKHGYVRRESGVFYRNVARCSQINFAQIRESVLSTHDYVVSRVRGFARTEYSLDWSDDDAASAIQSFLAEHSLKVLYASAEGSPILLRGSPKEAPYIVGALLTRAKNVEPALLDHFTVLVKGYLLANAIYLPDPGRVAQRFRDTKVYFDTSFLVFAAGFAGPERQAPCMELLELLREYGATLCCLKATFDEVRGILDACATRIRSGRLRDAYGPTIEYFIEVGKTASDVELMSARLAHKLRALGVSVEDKPPYEEEFQIAESSFEAAIEREIGYRNPRARVHDVDCISAVARLRRDRHSYDVETCRAVFVTTNSALAKVTRAFFQKEAPDGAAALCVTDYALGNLLWLKNPTKAPELPQRRLMADAFAAVQPPEDLWKAYLAEIAKLQERNQISADEYYVLRHSLTAKRILMDLTAGDATAFSEGTVSQILEVAKEHLRADLEERLGQEQRKREAAENTAQHLEEREVGRRDRVRTRAENFGRVLARTVAVVLFLVLVAGAFLSFPWALPAFAEAGARYLVGVLLAAFFVYTVANVIWGTTVSSISVRLERRLSVSVEKWLLWLSAI